MTYPLNTAAKLDLSYLKEMSGDSAEFIIEMLDTLVQQIPIYLNDLQQAVDQSDWKATAEFAHKVKPTFYYVGREDLRDFVQKIENDAKQLNVEHIKTSLDSLQAEFKNVLLQVEDAKAELLA